MSQSTARSYFDEMYASGPDPWGFDTRWYERRKYELTTAALLEPRYRSAFEPGCSIGVLSGLLAQRCDHLLATDVVPVALEQAADRLRHLANVTLELGGVPDAWPVGRFDLVVLSEIAYYFDIETLHELIRLTIETTSPGATVVAVHWRGATDYPLSGDEAHAIIGRSPHLERRVRHLEDDFILEVWRRKE